jgi:putative membrane protein
MTLLINAIVLIVALLHAYFLYFEMFAWTTTGRKIFRQFEPEMFEKTKVLAANQGLYNGFLVAGLVWSFFIADTIWQENIRFFFLGCVAVAGIYGGITASKKIFYVQAAPALLGIILLILF